MELPIRQAKNDARLTRTFQLRPMLHLVRNFKCRLDYLIVKILSPLFDAELHSLIECKHQGRADEHLHQDKAAEPRAEDYCNDEDIEADIHHEIYPQRIALDNPLPEIL